MALLSQSSVTSSDQEEPGRPCRKLLEWTWYLAYTLSSDTRADDRIVMMDAAPFYATQDRLAFRGISDSLSLHRLEGSECCLIHSDNPLSASKGVFLNPNARVGYNASAYETVNPPAGVPWLSLFDIIWGSWENRARRWLSSTWLSQSRTARKIVSWQAQGEARTETGKDCLIDEMQVVSWNGWAHI